MNHTIYPSIVPMKPRYSFNAFSLAVLVASSAYLAALPTRSQAQTATNGPQATAAGKELAWPREFQDNGVNVAIYQPQIEKWEGTDFETRAAVAITETGSNAP